LTLTALAYKNFLNPPTELDWYYAVNLDDDIDALLVKEGDSDSETDETMT
jgi:hypothetical protein